MTTPGGGDERREEGTPTGQDPADGPAGGPSGGPGRDGGWVPVDPRELLAADVAAGRDRLGGQPEQGEPAPGTGTVFVNVYRDGSWAASWQEGEDFVIVEGSREEVVGWALSRPATRWFAPDASGEQVRVDPASYPTGP